MQSPSSLEVKAHGLFHNLDHRTLQTDLGSILGNLKWTLFPSFLLPGGRPFELKVEATEQTGLQPKSFKDLKGEVKVYAPKNVTLTSSFLPCGKKVSLGAKVKQPIAGHATEGELKWTKGKPVAGEFEMRLNGRNKLQLETAGTNAQSVKWTLERARGLEQLKLKMRVPGREFIVGSDLLWRDQKWDLEYNVSKKVFAGKVKQWPLAFEVFTSMKEVGGGDTSGTEIEASKPRTIKSLSYKVTLEHKWLI